MRRRQTRQNYLAKLGDRGDWNENFKLAKEAMATGEPNSDLEPTMTPVRISGIGICAGKDHTGTPVAVVGVDFTMDEIQTFLKYSLKNLLVMMALLITDVFWYSSYREQQYYLTGAYPEKRCRKDGRRGTRCTGTN